MAAEGYDKHGPSQPMSRHCVDTHVMLLTLGEETALIGQRPAYEEEHAVHRCWAEGLKEFHEKCHVDDDDDDDDDEDLTQAASRLKKRVTRPTHRPGDKRQVDFEDIRHDDSPIDSWHPRKAFSQKEAPINLTLTLSILVRHSLQYGRNLQLIGSYQVVSISLH